MNDFYNFFWLPNKQELQICKFFDFEILYTIIAQGVAKSPEVKVGGSKTKSKYEKDVATPTFFEPQTDF